MPAPAPAATPPLQPHRVLLGWLSAPDAEHVLARQALDQPVAAAHQAAWRAASAAVAARAPGFDQTGVCTPLPAEFAPHLEALRQHAATSALAAAAGQPALVDLALLAATQLHIRIGFAAERVRDLRADDPAALTRLAFPLVTEEPLPALFEPHRNAWVLSSANPNLTLVGNFNQRVGPGFAGFGFAVALAPSFLHVARIGGRCFLRDGYHRAYGLLARGLRHVPAFVQDYPNFEAARFQPGTVPAAVALGDRPPRLTDYLDDTVSLTTELPVARKAIIIQALDVPLPG